MEKLFDEKYYEAELDSDEEKAAARAKDVDLKLMKDQEPTEGESSH
jgi:hypothetical protein